MRVNRLTMNNFRLFSDISIVFPKEQTTVLVGVNGCGKSSILECLAIMLSRVTGRIEKTTGTGRFFTDNDIKNDSFETSNEIEIEFWDRKYTYTVRKTKKRSTKGTQKITNTTEVKMLVNSVLEKLDNDANANVPIAVYYPVNRAIIDIPLRIKKNHSFNQLSAYEGSLSGGRNDFRIFFEWFRNQEDIENETRLEDSSYKDRQLEAVRKAIEIFLPGFRNLRVRRTPLRMIIEKNNEQLLVNQLSDGEKCLLALVGDLARRLAIANPSLNDPLKGSGVVLIDEIDLHLHPSWQRRVITGLEDAFLNCQFIVTTHSPLVLSNIKPNEIFLLRGEKKIALEHPAISFGRDINSILEELMETTERPPDIKDKINRYFWLIDSGKLQDAKELRNELEELVGSTEPEFARADILIRFKDILKE